MLAETYPHFYDINSLFDMAILILGADVALCREEIDISQKTGEAKISDFERGGLRLGIGILAMRFNGAFSFTIAFFSWRIRSAKHATASQGSATAWIIVFVQPARQVDDITGYAAFRFSMRHRQTAVRRSLLLCNQ